MIPFAGVAEGAADGAGTAEGRASTCVEPQLARLALPTEEDGTIFAEATSAAAMTALLDVVGAGALGAAVIVAFIELAASAASATGARCKEGRNTAMAPRAPARI